MRWHDYWPIDEHYYDDKVGNANRKIGNTPPTITKPYGDWFHVQFCLFQ